MMSGYEFDLSADQLAGGTNTIVVRDASGSTLQTVTLTKAASALSGLSPDVLLSAAVLAVAVIVVGLLVMRRRKRAAMSPPETEVRKGDNK